MKAKKPLSLVPLPDWKSDEERIVEQEIATGRRFEVSKGRKKKLERAAKARGLTLDEYVNQIITMAMAASESPDLAPVDRKAHRIVARGLERMKEKK